MIQRNQKKLNRLNVLSDGVLIVLCYLFGSTLLPVLLAQVLHSVLSK